MLRTIENEDFTRDGLCRDQVRVLRHVTRAVDFTIVVDFLDDLYPRRRRKGMGAYFAAFFVIVSAVKLVSTGSRVITLWDLDRGDLEVVLGLSGGVRSKQ